MLFFILQRSQSQPTGRAAVCVIRRQQQHWHRAPVYRCVPLLPSAAYQHSSAASPAVLLPAAARALPSYGRLGHYLIITTRRVNRMTNLYFQEEDVLH